MLRFLLNVVPTYQNPLLQAVSGDRTRASVTPKHCKAGQTVNEVPTNDDGVRQGATLEMVIKRE